MGGFKESTIVCEGFVPEHTEDAPMWTEVYFSPKTHCGADESSSAEKIASVLHNNTELLNKLGEELDLDALARAVNEAENDIVHNYADGPDPLDSALGERLTDAELTALQLLAITEQLKGLETQVACSIAAYHTDHGAELEIFHDKLKRIIKNYC